MVNSFYILGSLSLYNFGSFFATPEREKQVVSSIEERCTNIDSIFSLQIGSHSYLVLTTTTGEKIRIDYNQSSVEPDIIYDYYETSNSDIFRFSKVNSHLTVPQAVYIARKHSLKKKYCLISHNCQHVARDVFCEISGTQTSLLRNDFLEWFKQTVPTEMRPEMELENDLEKIYKVRGSIVAQIDNLSFQEFCKKYPDFFDDTRHFFSLEFFKNFDITKYLKKIQKTKEQIENFTNIWGKGLNITLEQLENLAKEMEKYEK